MNMMTLNPIIKSKSAQMKKRFLLLTYYSILFTSYQLPYTIYQQPTLPIDNGLNNGRLRQIEFSSNGMKIRLVGSISILLLGYFNHAFNQLWGCLNADSPTDPNLNSQNYEFIKMKVRIRSCGPA